MSVLSMEKSPFLQLAEAATFLRLAPRTLDNMRQRGTGPLYSKHGGRVVYHRNDLIDWSNQHRRRTTSEKVPRPPNEPDGPVSPDSSTSET